MSASTKQSSSDLGPGMNFADGDVKVISSDRVEFQLHSLYLSHASPYFRALLSNQRPAGPGDVLPSPVILEEPAWALRFLLQYVYPTPLRRPVEPLENAASLYRAATKLQIEVAVPLILASLVQLLEQTPNHIRAWAIALDLQLAGPRISAMKRISELPPSKFQSLLSGDVEELGDVTGLQLCALLSWGATETAYARSTIPRSLRQWFPGMGGVDAATIPTHSASGEPRHKIGTVANPLSFPDGDIWVEAADGVRFQLYTLFLSHASVHLAEVVLPNAEKTDDGRSTIAIDESSQALDILFRHIYPTPQKPSICDIEVAVDALRTARRLDIQAAIPLIMKPLTQMLQEVLNPLRAWAVAVGAGALVAQYQALARFLLLSETSAAQRIAENVEELRRTTGSQFRTVLEWRRKSVEGAQKALSFGWLQFCAHRSRKLPLGVVHALNNESLWGERILINAAFLNFRALQRGRVCATCVSAFMTASDIRLDMEARHAQALANAPLHVLSV